MHIAQAVEPDAQRHRKNQQQTVIGQPFSQHPFGPCELRRRTVRSNAQQLPDFIVRQSVEHRKSKHFSVAARQGIDGLEQTLRRNLRGRVVVVESCRFVGQRFAQSTTLFRGFRLPKREIAHNHCHPVHQLGFIAQMIDVGENNHEGIVQNVFGLRLIFDVAEADTKQLRSIGLIEFSQSLRVEWRSAGRFPMSWHHDRVYRDE